MFLLVCSSVTQRCSVKVLLGSKENVTVSTHVIYGPYCFSDALRNRIWTKNKDSSNFRLKIIIEFEITIEFDKNVW